MTQAPPEVRVTIEKAPVEKAPACCTRKGEVDNCACCPGKPFNWVMLTYGLLVLLAFIFASASSGANVWSSFEIGRNDVYVGLWRYLRDGSDDDEGEVEEAPSDKEDFEDYIGINWEAYETNRATTLMASLLTFPIALYYMISAACGRIKAVEFACSFLMFFLFILSLSGSSKWIDDFDNKFYFDDDFFDTEDEVICAGGCALQMFNAWYMLLLAVLLFSFAMADCCCCPERATAAAAQNEVEIPPVSNDPENQQASENLPPDQVHLKQ